MSSEYFNERKCLLDSYAMSMAIVEILKRNKITNNDEFESMFDLIKQTPQFKEAYDKIENIEKDPLLNLWNSIYKEK